MAKEDEHGTRPSDELLLVIRLYVSRHVWDYHPYFYFGYPDYKISRVVPTQTILKIIIYDIPPKCSSSYDNPYLLRGIESSREGLPYERSRTILEPWDTPRGGRVMPRHANVV